MSQYSGVGEKGNSLEDLCILHGIVPFQFEFFHGSAQFPFPQIDSIFIERIPNNPKTPENSVCYTQNSGWWEKNVRISMLSPFSPFSIHGLLHSSLAGLVGLGKVKSEVIQQNCLLFDFGPDQII